MLLGWAVISGCDFAGARGLFVSWEESTMLPSRGLRHSQASASAGARLKRDAAQARPLGVHAVWVRTELP